MKQVMLVKGPRGHLQPFDGEARSYLSSMRRGQPVLCSMRLPRNPAFHRKFFALIAFAFDHWTPPNMYEGRVAIRDRDSFRKQLTIAAGYHHTVLQLDGTVRLEARSIAWDQMGEQEFHDLYEAVTRVLAEGFLPGVDAETLEQWAAEYAEAA
jgi:hypothetical protein